MASEVRDGIEQAFVLRGGEIQSAVFEEWPDIGPFEPERLMNSLAANLYRYRRPADERFVNWAQAWVRRDARRRKLLTEMLGRYRQLLIAAIERSLHKSAGEDWAVEVEDHIADLQVYLLQNPRKIDVILNPKKAKTTSVLYGLARSRMRAVRSKIKDRRTLAVYWLADLLDSPGIPIADFPESEDEYEKNLSAA